MYYVDGVIMVLFYVTSISYSLKTFIGVGFVFVSRDYDIGVSAKTYP